MPTVIPHFNLWTIFILLAAGQGLFLTILVFTNRQQPLRERGWLAALLLVFSLLLLDYLGFWTRWHVLFPHFAGSFFWLTFLVGPLFWGYIQGVSISRFRLSQTLWHFIPALAVFLIRLPFLLSSTTNKILVLSGKAYAPNLLNIPVFTFGSIINYCTLIHLCIYAGLVYYKLPKRERLKTRFLRTLLGLYLLFCCSYLFYVVMVEFSLYNLELDYSIALVMAISIYTLAFIAFRKPQVFQQGELKAAFRKVKYQNSALTDEAVSSLRQQLEEIMETQQPYLDSALRLPKLADLLEVSSHHLSQVINTQFEQSFTTYINSYRLQRAKVLLRESEMQITEIAYEVGFNNKTSFYKAFKSATDLSPGDYRRLKTA